MAARLRSLRVELLATLAVVLVMAVLSLSLVSELLGHRRHIAQEIERIEDHARGLATILSPLLGDGRGAAQRDDTERVLRSSLGNAGIVAVEIYYGHDGALRPIATHGLAATIAAPAIALPDVSEAQVLEASGQIVVDRVVRTFARDRDQRYVLRLTAEPSAWTRIGDWQQALIVAGGVGLVLLVLGGLLIEAQILAPLRGVHRVATEVAHGNLDVDAPVDGPRELQALGIAFNRMTASLRSNLAELETQRHALVRAERLAQVGRIAAGVAHEVGNPLAAILGYVELLLDPRNEPPLVQSHRDMLERTRTQLLRIQTIVGQLLEYARPPKLRLDPLQLRNACEATLALVKHDPRVHGVQLSIAGEDVAVVADAGVLEQVLHNLILNACRAAKEGDTASPHVDIRYGSEGDHAFVDVIDSGPGVPQDVRARLFEPFFTTAKAGEGTGLGLAISSDLIESMHGTLTLRDVGDARGDAQDGDQRGAHDGRHALTPGGSPGAVFRVTLPRVRDAS